MTRCVPNSVIDLVIVFCALKVMTPGAPGEDTAQRTWITSPSLAEFKALLKLVSLQVSMMMVPAGFGFGADDGLRGEQQDEQSHAR